MSQNSLILPTTGTVSGLQMTQNINSALDTLVSVNSGASAPSTTSAYMFWADTAAGLLKQRNAANSAWIVRGSLTETRTVARSSNTVLGVGDFGKTFVASNTFTQTFNAASTLGDGWQCTYVNGGNGVITFDPNASETMDGLATVALAPGEGCVLSCDGNNLFSAGRSVAMRQNQTGTKFTTTGTAPSFNVVTSPLYTALATDQRFTIKFHAAGSGTNTLNRDGGTAANLKQYDSSGNKVTATITANMVADVFYDGNDYVVLDALPPSVSAITTATAQATTSGTNKDFTSIPATVKRITATLRGVSTNGTSAYRIQLGTGGSPTTSGYLGASTHLAAAAATVNFTAGFDLNVNNDAADVVHGSMTFVKESNDVWIGSGVFSQSNSARTITIAGSISLAGTLDNLRFTTVSGDTFDAGAVTILYE